MGVYLLQDLAHFAGATAILACLGCIIAAALGVQMSSSVLLPGDAAFGLAKLMAMMGGAAIFVAASTSTLYYWQIGVASGRATLMIETGVLAGGVVFAGMVGMLHERRRAGASR